MLSISTVQPDKFATHAPDYLEENDQSQRRTESRTVTQELISFFAFSYKLETCKIATWRP